MTFDVDDNGWTTGIVSSLAPEAAYTVFSPDPDARVDAARWAHQAERFFGTRIVVVQEKKYPAHTFPLADRLEIDVGAEPRRVLVVTIPVERAPDVLRAGRAAARAIGGAGMDVLVERAKRLWQISAEGDDARALAVAAVLASSLLGPIVTPDGAIFGVKGARERLARTDRR